MSEIIFPPNVNAIKNQATISIPVTLSGTNAYDGKPIVGNYLYSKPKYVIPVDQNGNALQ